MASCIYIVFPLIRWSADRRFHQLANIPFAVRCPCLVVLRSCLELSSPQFRVVSMAQLFTNQLANSSFHRPFWFYIKDNLAAVRHEGFINTLAQVLAKRGQKCGDSCVSLDALSVDRPCSNRFRRKFKMKTIDFVSSFRRITTDGLGVWVSWTRLDRV